MRRGQIITTDLMVSLILIAVSVGLIVELMDFSYTQTASTFEGAKMHQIALDAAAIEYYNRVDSVASLDIEGFDGSSDSMDYNVSVCNRTDCTIPFLNTDSDACVVSTRGSPADPVIVYVCRGNVF